MRIVAGQWRGRPLVAPPGRGTRPTSDRAREGLFSMLQSRLGSFEDLRVADLFAGTGALGLEAMSRGARYCLFVDDAAEARALVRRNIETLGLTGETRLFRRDATRLGPCAPIEPFGLAFLDPPYGRGLAEKALASLVAGGWLAPGALAVVEETATAELAVPDAFEVVETREKGETRLTFLRLR